MKIFCVFLLTVFFTVQLNWAYPQQIKFDCITKNLVQNYSFYGMAQDKQGVVWAVGFQTAVVQAALYKFDGTGFKIYKPDPMVPNTIRNFPCVCLYIDQKNIIWIGHLGGGIDRFDPATNTFTNIRHNPKDPNSLSSDSVYSIITDRDGNLWAGTPKGLNLMNAQTREFKHFFHQPGNEKSISSNIISILYTDHAGKLWIGCSGTIYSATPLQPGDGGLNLYDSKAGTFTNYFPSGTSAKNNDINRVSSIYEDSKGTFWIGTQKNGIFKMDRKTGGFTYLPYDPAFPEKLGSLPVGKEYFRDHITFMNEDVKGGLWIGSSTAGLYRYDPSTQKTTHFGSFLQDRKILYRDTSAGLVQYSFPCGFSTSDGLFWVSGLTPAGIFNVNFIKPIIPFEKLNNANGNAFYQEPGGHVLWIGTNRGLIRKDIINKTEKIWSRDSPNGSGWAHDTIGNMRRDKNGIFWIATLGGGLCRFDPAANKAVYYMHDNNNTGSISSNLARNLLIDHNDNIWIGTWGQGLDMLDTKTQKFVHYAHSADKASLSDRTADYIYEDKAQHIWVGTMTGLDRLNKDGKTFRHYYLNASLAMNPVLSIYTDSEDVMWVGGYMGLSYYDRVHDRFVWFKDPATEDDVSGVTAILEDDKKNLWLRTMTGIIKINSKRDQAKFYGRQWGVNVNNTWICRCLKGENDELFFGTLDGYFDFFPENITNLAPPKIMITGFQLTDETVKNGASALVNANTNELELAHDQNSFSVDFVALHYNSPGEEKYRLKLENYDHIWRDLGTEHRMPFFDVPPGKYVLRIKAFNADGASAERDLAIVIDPPWWQTWWAYTLFGLAIVGSIWGLIEYRGRKLISENKILEQKVNQRTDELQRSLIELKATQTQLIQSEKMASLGELTAGIAHEIQNPLNFVNNFSEVNWEMLEELKAESQKPKAERDDQLELELINDLITNEEKINHHGKRADAIVKGMLEHSRAGSGQKEPTDINALADEYLRLSYHGLRAKDKLFNAELITHFDTNLPKINVIPQDFGRVLLNLFNNAFYAVNQKLKLAGADYKPEVTVTTFTPPSGGLGVKVKDNGVGIPDAIKDKIMQPFFTTKPTGEGTGLGLSLTYDMVVKGHGGNIKAESVDGEGSEFTILLPVE
jgi:signal transduction histidine kinase/ligand-binding sensor domain-containing protein